MTDFDALADLAYNRNTLKPAEREDLTRLWKAFFDLEEWLFIMDGSTALASPSPFVGHVDEKPWFFVFTDSTRALEFAKKYELTEKSGECLYLSMKPESALVTLTSAEGQVEGIRVNEGPHGWFAPLANVHAIKAHLESLSLEENGL